MRREGQREMLIFAHLPHAGSEQAAQDLIDDYGPHIQRVVRRKLNQQMRSKFDSEDFVQMVWTSFFTEPERILRFQEPAELIGYLAGMAVNKLMQESRRRFTYQKHNVFREQSLENGNAPESSYVHRSNTPSQIVMAREHMNEIMRGQSDRNRRIVEMRMNGATYVEIAKVLAINERTAREVIEELAAASAKL